MLLARKVREGPPGKLVHIELHKLETTWEVRVLRPIRVGTNLDGTKNYLFGVWRKYTYKQRDMAEREYEYAELHAGPF
jgi:hypothetical protein